MSPTISSVTELHRGVCFERPNVAESAAARPSGAVSRALDVLVDYEAVRVLRLASGVRVSVVVGEAAGLAALGVYRLALLELRLAGVDAGARALGARVRRTLVAVLVCVQLEHVAGVPVMVDVVARHDGQFDTADRMTWAIAVLLAGRLNADSGWRGDGTAGCWSLSCRRSCRGLRGLRGSSRDDGSWAWVC